MKSAADNCLISKLEVKEYENATLLPSRDTNPGGVAEGASFIENSSLHRGKGGIYTYDERAVEYVDEEVLFVGMFFDCWGHCITDCLKHLWFVEDSELVQRFKDLRWVYIGFERLERLNENFRTCLKRLGIDEGRLTYISQVTRFKKLLIPDDCFRCDPSTNRRYYTLEYKSLIGRIISGIAPRVGPKVYFSRTAFSNHKDFGESVIETAFRNKGFEIVHPEKLSLEEQIAVLQGCSEFATTEGSISHNALFLKEGARCDIIRKSSFVNHYQAAINQMRDLDVRYFDSFCANLEYDDDKKEYGPFLMRVDKSLARYLGCRQTFPVGMYVKLKMKRFLHRLGLSELIHKILK